jgi:hypothetical protein
MAFPPVSSGGHAVPTAHAVYPAHRGRPARAARSTAPTRPYTTLWGLGDPVKSCLAGTGWCHGGWIRSKLHMAEDLSDDLPLGHRGNDPQRPLMAKWAGGQIEGKHPLQQTRPAPVRCGVAGIRLFPTLLAWRWRDRAAQAAVRARQPPYRTRWTHGSGTSAASFSNSSRGESVMPVVPSDHGRVTRAASSADTTCVRIGTWKRSGMLHRWRFSAHHKKSGA